MKEDSSVAEPSRALWDFIINWMDGEWIGIHNSMGDFWDGRKRLGQIDQSIREMEREQADELCVSETTWDQLEESVFRDNPSSPSPHDGQGASQEEQKNENNINRPTSNYVD